MKQEHSYGAVVFRKEGKQFFYLLLYRKAHLYYKESWDFPRGLLEKNETGKEDAIREIKEETGITDLKFISPFEEKTSWVYRKGKNLVHKEATYYLAQTTTKEIVISVEHDSFKWCMFEEALKLLSFGNTKTVLNKAHELLLTLPKQNF